MIEKALERAYGATGARGRTERRRRLWLDGFIVAATLAVAVGVLPVVYLILVFGQKAWPLDAIYHAYLNGLVNVLVAIWCLRLEGRLDLKLAAVASRAMTGHGLLAFIILMVRPFHSNQMMVVSLVMSVALGVIVMLVRHRLFRPKVAVLGVETKEALLANADRVRDPDTPLADYDLLLIPSMADLPPKWTPALSQAMIIGTPMRHIAEYVEAQTGRVSLEHFDPEHLPAAGLTTYRMRKRMLDIIIVLLTAPIAILILAVASLLILATMGRPIRFVQPRVGLGGRRFQMTKLRTMRVEPIENTARATESGQDARVTPLGRVLRRFRIDELPQLWHVLKGDMSIVGPRPEWTVLSESYTDALPVYAYRHLVRPGITGWAQVRGGYASDLEETRVKVEYDLFYVKNLSLGLDLQILARTVWILVSGSGAR